MEGNNLSCASESSDDIYMDDDTIMDTFADPNPPGTGELAQ
jgi:hypothetical protein